MWQEKNKQLYKKFEFKDFTQAFEFMKRVATEAEGMDHHPKWQNEYNKVEIWLSTHSEGKVTSKDHKLAEGIDKIYNGKNTSKLSEAKLYTDGGSRGNPGESAAAFAISNLDDNVVEKSGFYLGRATNNQAEYEGLKRGLTKAKEIGVEKLIVHMDSELIIKQMNGLYKVKHPDLLPLHHEAKALAADFGKIEFVYVPRALNWVADAEVNRILDEHSSGK